MGRSRAINMDPSEPGATYPRRCASKATKVGIDTILRSAKSTWRIFHSCCIPSIPVPVPQWFAECLYALSHHYPVASRRNLFFLGELSLRVGAPQNAWRPT